MNVSGVRANRVELCLVTASISSWSRVFPYSTRVCWVVRVIVRVSQGFAVFSVDRCPSVITVECLLIRIVIMINTVT